MLRVCSSFKHWAFRGCLGQDIASSLGVQVVSAARFVCQPSPKNVSQSRRREVSELCDLFVLVFEKFSPRPRPGLATSRCAWTSSARMPARSTRSSKRWRGGSRPSAWGFEEGQRGACGGLERRVFKGRPVANGFFRAETL